MFRVIVNVASFLLLAGSVLPAQERRSRVVLDSGKVVIGVLDKVDATDVVIREDGRSITVPLTQVVRIERDVATTESTPPAAGAPRPARHQAHPSPSHHEHDGIDLRLEGMIQRYAWVIPTDARNRASLGVLVFLALALVIRLGAHLVELAHADFARCCLGAALTFAMIIGNLLMPHLDLPVLIGSLMLQLALWLAMTRAVFGARLYEGLVLLVSCIFSGVVAVLLIEVSSWVLDSTHQVG